MNFTLIIIIVSAILPIGIITLVFTSLMKGKAAHDQLLKTGQPARGRILQLGHTGMSVAVMGHRHIKLMLTCEVHPSFGPPYQATFEQLVSELQLGSVQPGAQVDLRVDPANPQRIAMAAVIPAGQPMQQQGAWGQQPHAGWGHQQQGGFVQAPIAMGIAQPNYKSSLPMVLIILFFTTVPITVIMVWAFVDTSQWFGTEEQKSKGGVCGQLVECCKTVSGENGSCDNYKNLPAQGCQSALDSMRQAAKAQNKTCD